MHGVVEVLQHGAAAQQLAQGVALVLGQLDALTGPIDVPLVVHHEVAPAGLVGHHADAAAGVGLQVEADPHSGQVGLGHLPHWTLLSPGVFWLDNTQSGSGCRGSRSSVPGTARASECSPLLFAAT